MAWIIFAFSQGVWKCSCQGMFSQLPEQHLSEVKTNLKIMAAMQNFQKPHWLSHDGHPKWSFSTQA